VAHADPAVEVSTGVKQVTNMRKPRCGTALRHLGGGTVNVARLGGYCIAVYLAGEPLGQELRRLVDAGALVQGRQMFQRCKAWCCVTLYRAGAIPGLCW
jgi:hypothetical protein